MISYFVFFILFSYLIKHFDKKFDELLKRYSEPKDNLFIIKFLLSQYIIVLDKKIENYLTQSSSKPSGINFQIILISLVIVKILLIIQIIKLLIIKIIMELDLHKIII